LKRSFKASRVFADGKELAGLSVEQSASERREGRQKGSNIVRFPYAG
jgi:hypothetical protein